MNKGDGFMPVRQGQGIWSVGATCSEIQENNAIDLELWKMVDEGLLNMGVDPESGEVVFWATPNGAVALGMA